MKVVFWRNAFEPKGYVTETEIGRSGTDQPLLNRAWELFNRGSGSEVQFDGPSASVDDCFILYGAGQVPRVYYVLPSGFTQRDIGYNPVSRRLFIL